MKIISFTIILCCLVLHASFFYAENITRTTVIVNEATPDRACIRATGTGFPPSSATDQRQARLLARRAAIVDGYRNLIRSIDGMEPLIGRGTVIRTTHGFVKGAKVLDTRYLKDGKVEADVGVEIHGRVQMIKNAGYAVLYEALPEHGEELTQDEWVELKEGAGIDN